MKFGNLTYLFLLWVLPCLVFFFIWAFLRKDRLIRQFCGDVLAPRLIPAVQKGRQKLKAFLLVASVFFLIIALVQPKWGFHWEDIKRVGVDIIVAVDVSKSMLAEDVTPSRLERAKREVYDLCRMLEGDRIGLIAFAGSSFVQCPLTLDYGAFRMFLDYLSPDLIPTPGTAVGTAIRRATASFSRQERKSKALIVITDGEDHESDPLEAAREAKKEGVKIYTIGIGKEGGTPIPVADGSGGFLKDRSGNVVLSKLDETTLQKIALETGGAYVRSVTGDMDLDKIYRSEIRGTIEKKELRSTRKKRWEERFQWFIFIGLVLVGLEFFIRERT
ncbi:VWA domain-containing protein [Thermodesulfobacteriota bacterium]